MSEERRYFVYIMANDSKRLYTGMTNRIRQRAREHKLKLTPSFAAQYNMTRLVYLESFEDVRNAIVCLGRPHMEWCAPHGVP